MHRVASIVGHADTCLLSHFSYTNNYKFANPEGVEYE
jgi:hypothetical protein